jgi:NAD(P)-dependent dehydrogenase (short-subunit alcohol dehydrogenase family)
MAAILISLTVCLINMSPDRQEKLEAGRPEFDGKVALVVGASRGIGASAARAFARAGARVVLASRDTAALDAVAEEIRGDGGEAFVQTTDLAEPRSVEALGASLRARYGRLDCAFNNAGEGMRPRPLAEIPPDDFDRVQQVTVRGTFLALRAEIPLLVASGGGAIVNMASTAGVSGFPGGGAYITAKHAILGLTKSAALDYAQAGVRVNAVAPGPIETERLKSLTDADRDRVVKAVPMRRLGQPGEVADAVLWLCSSASRFVTGATLFLDGGRMAGVA